MPRRNIRPTTTTADRRAAERDRKRKRMSLKAKRDRQPTNR